MDATAGLAEADVLAKSSLPFYQGACWSPRMSRVPKFPNKVQIQVHCRHPAQSGLSAPAAVVAATSGIGAGLGVVATGGAAAASGVEVGTSATGAVAATGTGASNGTFGAGATPSAARPPSWHGHEFRLEKPSARKQNGKLQSIGSSLIVPPLPGAFEALAYGFHLPQGGNAPSAPLQTLPYHHCQQQVAWMFVEEACLSSMIYLYTSSVDHP